MKHDLKVEDEVRGIFVKHGILDLRYLAMILKCLHLHGRVLVTGVKQLDLPHELMEACAKAAEAKPGPTQ